MSGHIKDCLYNVASIKTWLATTNYTTTSDRGRQQQTYRVNGT